MQNVEDKGD